ncbi:alpha/beta hydrolase family protein [Sphingobium sp. B11D3D]|uniref:alpha/beta hydrolase family protein n=1 Tax=Sphingobium sp. B11D3D TaxID=2940576 RepID=UPI002224DF2D|nr:alpha/beta hydrolase-fold protein [Sphingobium sp. B11D3D]MCW2369028.1 dienelactone hydrolase [Sphingobium sp. B11D3D]
MKHVAPLLCALAAILQAPSASAQIPSGIIGAPGGTGDLPAIAEGRADAPGYTIYRPAKLPQRRLPLVLWGNGGCRNDGLSASGFLREIASHGYIVIANGAPKGERPSTEPAAGNQRGPEPPMPPPATADETSVDQLLAAIDWVKGSPYGRDVDTKQVAVMGHSCGGLQALAAAADPRIRTAIIFNSGVYNRPGNGLSRVSIAKNDLRKLHTPVAYILGGPTDIAYPNGNDDVGRIAHVPVFYANKNTGHGGTFGAVNGGDYGRIAVAWLDWQLKRDAKAGQLFTGASCGLCKDPAWTLVRKQFPEKP